MTIIEGDYLFRWAGGTFIAVWSAQRADEHVPDDMISLPDSLNRAKVGREDIERLALSYVDRAEAA